MREICDKHFNDNWVCPIYGGQLADLQIYWASFPAARTALLNNIKPDMVTKTATFHMKEVNRVTKRLSKYIIDGQLQELSLIHI